MREAIRDLLAAQSGLEADVAAATAELDAAAQRARIGVRFADGESRLEPAAGGRARRGRARPRRGLARDGRRHVGADEGVPCGRLPLGVHRHREEPLTGLVLDEELRQP